MKLLKWTLATCIIILTGTIAFASGYYYGWYSFEPRAVPQYIEIPPETVYEEIPVYVDKVEYKTEYQEKLIEVPAETKEFGSLQELEDYVGDAVWLGTGSNQCLSICRNYYRKCLKDGYQVSVMPLSYYEYTTRFKNPVPFPSNYWHVVIMAIIGTDMYLVEPQTGEIVYLGRGF